MKTLLFCAAVLISAPGLHGCFNAPINAATALSSARTSTRTQSKDPISRANFVSLKWQRSGGYAGIQTQVFIHNGTMQLHQGAPDNKKPAQSKALNKPEFQSILKTLNDARFTKIVGKYYQPGLMDGFGDVITLVLQTPGEKPQLFVVDNYGDKAPQAFYKVRESLRALKNKKFAGERN